MHDRHHPVDPVKKKRELGSYWCLALYKTTFLKIPFESSREFKYSILDTQRCLI